MISLGHPLRLAAGQTEYGNGSGPEIGRVGRDRRHAIRSTSRPFRGEKPKEKGPKNFRALENGGGVLPEGKRTGNSDPRSCLATASFCQFAHRSPTKTDNSTQPTLQICGRRFKSENHHDFLCRHDGLIWEASLLDGMAGRLRMEKQHTQSGIEIPWSVVGMAGNLVDFGPRRDQAKLGQPASYTLSLATLHNNGGRKPWVGLSRILRW